MHSQSKRQTSMFIPYYLEDDKIYIFLQKRGVGARNPNSVGAFGGGTEGGENNELALLREIKEELEYTPNKYELIGTYEDEYSISNYYVEKVNKNFTDKIIINEGEGGDWYEETEIIKLVNISTNTKNVINEIIKKFK